MKKELEEVKENIARMESEMVEFGDLEGLRSKAEAKRKDLSDKKEELEGRKTGVSASLAQLEQVINVIKVGTNISLLEINNINNKLYNK